MSRCFPFPPPGYEGKGVSGQALVELLKVRREEAQAKKEKKREKKRRRKEKKEHLDLEEREITSEKQSHRHKHKHRRRKKSRKSSDNQGKRENETQAFERSSVTEELEQPISKNLYDSSDNNQKIKRQKHNWYPSGCYNHGSIVGLDFQLQKHKDPEVLLRKPGCSTSKTDFVVQEKLELAPNPIKEQFCSTYGGSTTTAQELAHKDMCHSSSQKIEASKNKKAEMAMPSNLSKSGMLHLEAQFKKLTLDWVPPPIQSGLSKFDDQEWLSEKRLPNRDMIERSDASNDDLGRGSSTLYPSAEYLPQAGIYALPFTTPF